MVNEKIQIFAKRSPNSCQTIRILKILHHPYPEKAYLGKNVKHLTKVRGAGGLLNVFKNHNDLSKIGQLAKNDPSWSP
jgi:hypothetical protein